jgi:hypothetical protein
MVQVDVFWSYGIGAGFAMANSRVLEAPQPASGEAAASPYDHPAFRDALLYLGCLFVPSGAFLIWQFTSWETMHVATAEDIPGWLMAGFTMTNFTQGILGFAVATAFLRRRKPYAAYLQWVLGHLAMMFILVHGWDGSGYQRFLSSTREDFLTWTWDTGRAWLTGPVALSLLTMGLAVIPGMFLPMARDLKRGYAFSGREDRARIGTVPFATALFLTLLAGTTTLALVASLAIRYLGVMVGVPVALLIGYVALRRRGPWHRHFSRTV